MVQLYRRKGGEILVNTETSGSQSANHVAALSGGGFILVWSDASALGTDNSDSAVRAQRFDADGNKVGGEILVNSAVAGFQGQPKVTGLDGGRFVVTWSNLNGDDADGPDSGIRGQLFNADGTRSGTEFLINSSAPGIQLAPVVTSLTGGGFVVSWTDGSGSGGDADNSIKMQMFDTTGAKVGGELLANTVTAGAQTACTVTALSSGGFAVSWVGPAVVKCQVFDALGAKVGTEQQVNTAAVSALLTPSMAALGTGFVVVWSHSDGAGDTDGFDVSAQLFDAGGAKIGGEFGVNTTAAGDQRVPEVRTLPGGYFLVTWQGPSATGPDIDLYGQVFTATGEKVGVEFVVNGVTSADQVGARIAVLASGDVVITWADNSGIGGDFSSFGVKMQILTLTTDAPTDIALSNATLSETAFDNAPVATLSATGALNTSFTYTIVSDSTGGAFRIDGDQLVVDDNRLLDFETDPSAEVRIRVTDLNGNSYEETMTLTLTDSPIEARYSAGDEFRVNTDTAGFNVPDSITVLASGGFLIVTSYFVDGLDNGTRGQVYDAAGNPVGLEFEIDLPNRGSGGLQTVALPSGGFVIVYEGAGIDLGGGSNGFPIRARIFDADGDPVGGDILVSTNNQGQLIDPDVAVLASGDFVITWTRPQDEPGGSGGAFPSQIAAQMFDADGDRIGDEFRVNTGIEGQQILSHVAALPGGGFVVTWREPGAGGDEIEGQFYDAGGAKVGGEFTALHDGNAGYGHRLNVLESGNLLVSWVFGGDVGGVDVFSIYAQLVSPAGVNIGDPFPLVSATLGSEYNIAALPGGGFAMVWSSLDHFDQALDDVQTYGLIFNASGERVNEGFLVPESTLDDEGGPEIAVLDSGDLAFAWSRTFDENGAATNDVYARILSLKDLDPIVGTSGDDMLIGTPGDDLIQGLDGRDILDGLEGDDRLEGGDGRDDLIGGLGDDELYGGDGIDWLFETAGANDRLYGEAGDDELHYVGGFEPDVADALLDGGTGDDLLEFVSHNFDDTATLIGGDGHDRFQVAGGAEIVVDAGADSDLVQLLNFETHFDVSLGAGADILLITTYAFRPADTDGFVTVGDFEIGAAGDAIHLADYLPWLLTGWDFDANPFATGHLQLIQRGVDAVIQYDRDGAGDVSIFTDLIVLENISTGALTAHNLGGYAADGSAAIDGIFIGTAGKDFLTGDGGDDLVQGLGGDDILFGGGGDDRLEGGDGVDILDGDIGSDELHGGAGDDLMGDVMVGDDRLYGEDGKDFIQVDRQFYLDAPAGNVLVDGGAGDDTIIFYGRALTGDADLRGGGDNDGILAFGGGAVTIDGGAGADLILIDVTALSYRITLGAGSDILRLAHTTDPLTAFTIVDFTTGNGGDILEMAQFLGTVLNGWDGMANPYGTGHLLLAQSGANALILLDRDGGGNRFALLGTLENVSAAALTEVNIGLATGAIGIAGTDGADSLSGTAGDDRIVGFGGDDVINGQGGTDVMTGGAGDDTYVVDQAGDVINEAEDEGNDRIYATANYALAADSYVETLAAGGANPVAAINLTGNALANNLWGNEGANRLDGKAGDDFVFGFGGDDVIFGGEGADFMVGGDGNDTLLGGAGADNLIGLEGNDYLDGAAGADLMQGGDGDDVYVVDDAGEAINETLTGGSDRVYALVDYILTAGAYIEILQAGGPDPLAGIDLGGNEFTNNIWGNEGANVIDGRNGDDFLFGFGGDDVIFGGEGADFMVGGLGNDTLLGGNGADNLIGLEGNDYLDGAAGADLMSGGDGDDIYVVDDAGEAINETATGGTNDRVYALVDYILTAGAYIEVLQAGGPDPLAGIDLGGNELTNNIWGNEGANAIDGRNGDDFLFGYGGDDTLFGGEGNDFMVGGNGNDTLLGQNGADILIGEAGGDYLDGGGAADTMNGGAGDDLYVLDNALDVIQEVAGEGADRAYALVDYTLAAGVEVEVLAAGGPDPNAALALTGNALSNQLWGNAGANVLDGKGGIDVLIGQGGADAFTFTTAFGLANYDTITDFVSGTDKILLDDAVFAGIGGLGALGANALVTGPAQDADDRVLYDATTGLLFYDSDGNGAGAAVLFATLLGAPGLNASDFIVF